MALDHFSRAAAIDEAARVLRHPYTHRMTGQSEEQVKQQIAIGELLATTKLEPARDRLIEAGIQFWKNANAINETVGTSTVPSGQPEGQTQETPSPRSEDGQRAAYAARVREHASDIELRTEIGAQLFGKT